MSLLLNYTTFEIYHIKNYWNSNKEDENLVIILYNFNNKNKNIILPEHVKFVEENKFFSNGSMKKYSLYLYKK